MENTSRRYQRREEVDQLASELSGNLPREIILDILTRLPLKSLSCFRWVSKSWYNTITHTQFAITHLLNSLHTNTSPCVLVCNKSSFALIDHQPFDDHQICTNTVNLNLKQFEQTFPEAPVGISGSINGLLCFYTKRGTIPTLFYVCNPITQEHVVLPKSPDCRRTHDVVGFGFDSGSNEYKVIRIFSRVFTMARNVNVNVNADQAYHAEAEIYTLGSGTWRRIENVPYVNMYRVRGVSEASAFANGSLHWFTRESEVIRTLVILSFNLTTEEFGVIIMPPAITSISGFKFLAMTENQLCVATITVENEVSIWVMKEYGVDESWSRLYVFKDHVMPNVYLGPFEMMKVKNGEFLLWGLNPNKNSGVMQPSPKSNLDRYGDPRYLHYYDSQTKKVAPIQIQSDSMFYELFVFRGSLLSPKRVERSIYRMRLA